MSSAKETLLDVIGMTCASCVRHVEGALRKVEGVEGASVMLKEGRARVRHAPNVAIEDMIAAVDAAGYESRPHGSVQ